MKAWKAVAGACFYQTDNGKGRTGRRRGDWSRVGLAQECGMDSVADREG